MKVRSTHYGIKNYRQTDRATPNNKLDAIIGDNEKGTRMLLKAVLSRDRNAFKKQAEKILKYTERTIETQRMWNVKKKSDTSNNKGKTGSFQNHLN